MLFLKDMQYSAGYVTSFRNFGSWRTMRLAADILYWAKLFVWGQIPEARNTFQQITHVFKCPCRPVTIGVSCRLQQLTAAQQLARCSARAANIPVAAADAPGAELCHGAPGHARLPNRVRQPAFP